MLTEQYSSLAVVRMQTSRAISLPMVRFESSVALNN
jgi:hypothetical protein